jgi:hypothetical protein
MAKKTVRLAPGTRIDNPWPLQILAQDGYPVPVYMVKGGPNQQGATWVPKTTVVQWLADAGVTARIGG